MSPNQFAFLILLLVAGTFVCVAAYWDVREKRIPNRVTLPMFYAGWVYQLILSLMDGWHHLGSGAIGFLIGFGLLFVLWFVGSGGGGDVKLMGALGIWLGGWMTLQVLVATLVIILCVSLARRLGGLLGRRPQTVPQASPRRAQSPAFQPSQKVERRLMTFAGPVAVATWAVLILSPWLNADSRGQDALQKAVVQQIQK